MRTSFMIEKYLVQIVDLALKGDKRDLRLYTKKLSRKLRKDFPRISKKLDALMEESQVSRNLAPTLALPGPVDPDSRKDLIFEGFKEKHSFDPIWQENINQVFEQIKKERKNWKLLKKQGLRPTKSMLFYGPPGMGKTFGAKWLANQIGLPFFVLDLGNVISSYLGKTGNNLKSVLDYTSSIPCVLLLDEFDSLGKSRGDLEEVGELKRLVTVLLQAFDNWNGEGLIIAATNHPDLLDSASWRRFDLCVEFPSPPKEIVFQLIKRFFSKNLPEEKNWINIFSFLLAEKSFSDIQNFFDTFLKTKILYRNSFEENLKQTIKILGQKFPHKSLIEGAKSVFEAKMVSQRVASEIFGVSRDTIRKKVGN